MAHISGFHRLSPDERRQALLSVCASETLHALVDSETAVPLAAYDRMTENVIGTFRLPLSAVTAVLVNGIAHPAVMVTEEPSVVAAANAATALFERCGGVHAELMAPVTSAQIVLSAEDPVQAFDACAHLESMRMCWLEMANACDPKLVAVGGGAFDITFECMRRAGDKHTFIVARLDVHTADIMGANAVNTMAEAILDAIANEIASWRPDANVEKLMAILTNAAPGRLVRASVRLPFKHLDGYRKHVPGQHLAHKIELASRFAAASPERAVTHNKGILNGILAAAIPLGQDTRAIAASALDHACRSGTHKPLSAWTVSEDSLLGVLTMPIVAGSVGGTRHALPTIAAAFDFDKIRSYEDLCALLSALGLAQNFAALAALVTDGIQQGHMKLHRRKRDL